MKIHLDFNFQSQTAGHMFIDQEAKDRLLEFLTSASIGSSLDLAPEKPDMHLRCIQVQAAKEFTIRNLARNKPSRIKDIIGLLSCAILIITGIAGGSFLASLAWMWLNR